METDRQTEKQMVDFVESGKMIKTSEKMDKSTDKRFNNIDISDIFDIIY